MPEKLKDKRTIFIFPENGNFGDLAMQTGKVLFFFIWPLIAVNKNWILIILAIKLNLSFLELYHYDETKQFNEYPQIIIWVQTIQQDSWKLVALMMTR